MKRIERLLNRLDSHFIATFATKKQVVRKTHEDANTKEFHEFFKLFDNSDDMSITLRIFNDDGTMSIYGFGRYDGKFAQISQDVMKDLMNEQEVIESEIFPYNLWNVFLENEFGENIAQEYVIANNDFEAAEKFSKSLELHPGDRIYAYNQNLTRTSFEVFWDGEKFTV